MRNDLTHHKTKKSDDDINTPDFPEDFEPDKCLKLIRDFLKNFHEIDKSDEFANFVFKAY